MNVIVSCFLFSFFIYSLTAQDPSVALDCQFWEPAWLEYCNYTVTNTTTIEGYDWANTLVSDPVNVTTSYCYQILYQTDDNTTHFTISQLNTMTGKKDILYQDFEKSVQQLANITLQADDMVQVVLEEYPVFFAVVAAVTQGRC